MLTLLMMMACGQPEVYPPVPAPPALYLKGALVFDNDRANPALWANVNRTDEWFEDRPLTYSYTNKDCPVEAVYATMGPPHVHDNGKLTFDRLLSRSKVHAITILIAEDGKGGCELTLWRKDWWRDEP